MRFQQHLLVKLLRGDATYVDLSLALGFRWPVLRIASRLVRCFPMGPRTPG